MTGSRTFLHTLPTLTWDVNAVKKGRVGERGQRRVAGKRLGLK